MRKFCKNTYQEKNNSLYFFQVAKNRYSGDLGIMALEFDKAGLSYAQKKKKSEDVIPKDLPKN